MECSKQDLCMSWGALQEARNHNSRGMQGTRCSSEKSQLTKEVPQHIHQHVPPRAPPFAWKVLSTCPSLRMVLTHCAAYLSSLVIRKKLKTCLFYTTLKISTFIFLVLFCLCSDVILGFSLSQQFVGTKKRYVPSDVISLQETDGRAAFLTVLALL